MVSVANLAMAENHELGPRGILVLVHADELGVRGITRRLDLVEIAPAAEVPAKRRRGSPILMLGQRGLDLFGILSKAWMSHSARYCGEVDFHRKLGSLHIVSR